MKKSIPKVRERESQASILGNVREREYAQLCFDDCAHKHNKSAPEKLGAPSLYLVSLALPLKN